jgi:hypothetical protein
VNLKTLLFSVGLSLILVEQTLHGQQSDADSQRLAESRANAERGDSKAQYELGLCYYKSVFEKVILGFR